MSEFLAEDNPCSQLLLHLIARGNAIIAEILRLKDYVPSIYRLETKQDQQKYGEIISDFLYFKTPDEFEKKIEKNPQLRELDVEIRDSHMEILNRVFVAFEGIHKYACDINQFVEEIEDGIYIQQSLETLFYNGEGKQLLCEMLYLYGVLLLHMDVHIEGVIRERLLVSYYRYSAQRYTGTTTVDDVCKLIRSTGFNSNKRPADYPVDYFRRVLINEEYVNMVIGRLRTDDIYNQISTWPSPEHRSTALSCQAAMLFVCLFFNPTILHSQTAKMREIVDKYFPDNWVTSIYMGLTVNLIDMWDSFRAAKLALGNTLEMENLQYQASSYATKLKKCVKQTQQWLKEGVITEENISDNIGKIIEIFRECNVTLRWFIMHTAPAHSIADVSKRCKQIRDQIIANSQYDPFILYELLLNTAQFELDFKEFSKKLIQEKEQKWEFLKKQCVDHMMELSEVFSGEKPLTRLPKIGNILFFNVIGAMKLSEEIFNEYFENLQNWFKDVSTQIESLNIEKVKSSSRKIIQLLQALENVQGFHQLSDHHQVYEYIREVRKYLMRMVKLLTLKEDILVNLQIIGDLSYAWNLIDNFTCFMQDGIKKHPASSSQLRATFLKLSSALETPLLRINQAGSEDLVSVSQYYSQQLVTYISRVLDVIPQTMFELMAQIIHLQTNAIKELPTRLDKDKLKDYAQLDDRMEVARLTHAVSVLSNGILKMKSTLVGIVRIDPKQLLEDGIRRELVKHVALSLHEGLVFNSKLKIGELSPKLKDLSEKMDGYQRSFEYIQDYIDMYGLKIWQEELSRIIGFNVEQQCNSFLRNKIQPWQSNYYNTNIPIPTFPLVIADNNNNHSVNFIGRLISELIRITDPKCTIYVENSMAWFDLKTQIEVVNFRIFSEIRNSIGVCGLTGLDRVFCFMIVAKLQVFLKTVQQNVMKEKFWSDLMISATETFAPNNKIIENPQKVYGQFLGKLHRLPSGLLNQILQIGQLQILRKQISYELQISCKFDSRRMYSCLEAFNQSLLNDIRAHYKNPISRSYPKKENCLLLEATEYLDWAGIGNPYSKIYVTATSIQHFALLSFLFTAFQLQKLQWQKSNGTLTWKKVSEPLDGAPYIIGLQTIYKQFHPKIRGQFLSYISQYLKSLIGALVCVSGKIDVPTEIHTVLHFLKMFTHHSGLEPVIISNYIPDTLLHVFEILASSS